jgi:hypothetical protein
MRVRVDGDGGYGIANVLRAELLVPLALVRQHVARVLFGNDIDAVLLVALASESANESVRAKFLANVGNQLLELVGSKLPYWKHGQSWTDWLLDQLRLVS